jgi:hypothetical protein
MIRKFTFLCIITTDFVIYKHTNLYNTPHRKKDGYEFRYVFNFAGFALKINVHFQVVYVVLPSYVGPCHHGRTCHRVPDGGDGLHIWRIAANIFNKHSRRADKDDNIKMDLKKI